MHDFLIIVTVLAIVVLAAGYVYKAKKRGVKCIGCPGGCSCGSKCGQNTCGGNCGKHE